MYELLKYFPLYKNDNSYSSVLTIRNGFFRCVLTTFCIFDELWEEQFSLVENGTINDLENYTGRSIVKFERSILQSPFEEVEIKGVAYLRNKFS